MNDPFYRLIIDTSSEYSLAGIANGGEVIVSHITPHANALSQTLLPTLQTLLQEAGVALNQLQEIAIGIGPGSYTGTRVGVAIAKALSFGLQGPRLRGFCSLLAFLPPADGTFACVMPSKTGEFYLLKGARSGDDLTCSHSTLLSMEALTEELANVDHLIGKPLKEVQTLLPAFAARWALNTPTLDAILAHLNSTEMADSDVSLIYLHKP